MNGSTLPGIRSFAAYIEEGTDKKKKVAVRFAQITGGWNIQPRTDESWYSCYLDEEQFNCLRKKLAKGIVYGWKVQTL